MSQFLYLLQVCGWVKLFHKPSEGSYYNLKDKPWKMKADIDKQTKHTRKQCYHIGFLRPQPDTRKARRLWHIPLSDKHFYHQNTDEDSLHSDSLIHNLGGENGSDIPVWAKTMPSILRQNQHVGTTFRCQRKF